MKRRIGGLGLSLAVAVYGGCGTTDVGTPPTQPEVISGGNSATLGGFGATSFGAGGTTSVPVGGGPSAAGAATHGGNVSIGGAGGAAGHASLFGAGPSTGGGTTGPMLTLTKCAGLPDDPATVTALSDDSLGIFSGETTGNPRIAAYTSFGQGACTFEPGASVGNGLGLDEAAVAFGGADQIYVYNWANPGPSNFTVYSKTGSPLTVSDLMADDEDGTQLFSVSNDGFTGLLISPPGSTEISATFSLKGNEAQSVSPFNVQSATWGPSGTGNLVGAAQDGPRVYVLTQRAAYVYGPNGAMQLELAKGDVKNAVALAVSAAGVDILDAGTPALFRYSPGGTLMSQASLANAFQTGFETPAKLAVTSDGTRYVATQAAAGSWSWYRLTGP